MNWTGYKYFRNINCIEDLKAQYKKLAFMYHPDVVQDESLKDSALEAMKIINSEYSELFKIFKNTYRNSEGEAYRTKYPTDEIPEDFINIIHEVIRMKNVQVELCGRWIWCTGNTKEYKDTFKRLHFFWSGKKAAWYYHHPMDKSHSREKYSLDQIRSIYGSKVYENELTPELS